MNDIAERFQKDTASHQMVPLRDDGLYRHLRFVSYKPHEEGGTPQQSSLYWFDLITWPAHLVITGDCGTFAFSRELDMFGFFRGNQINPGYWAEKVCGETRVKSYSEDLFRQRVKEDAADAEAEYPGVSAAIEERFYRRFAEWDVTCEDGARRALEEFRYVPKGAPCPKCSKPGEPVALVRERPFSDTLRCPEGCGTEVEPFAFADTWEWDLGDWDWRFLWCCHAIQWGIARRAGAA